MPQITLKETITEKIEIPMDTLYQIIDNLADEERKKLIERLKEKPVKLKHVKNDKHTFNITNFTETNLYEEEL